MMGRCPKPRQETFEKVSWNFKTLNNRCVLYYRRHGALTTRLTISNKTVRPYASIHRTVLFWLACLTARAAGETKKSVVDTGILNDPKLTNKSELTIQKSFDPPFSKGGRSRAAPLSRSAERETFLRRFFFCLAFFFAPFVAKEKKRVND